jgi:hypothetical protein
MTSVTVHYPRFIVMDRTRKDMTGSATVTVAVYFNSLMLINPELKSRPPKWLSMVPEGAILPEH